jgi:hypothetical protein
VRAGGKKKADKIKSSRLGNIKLYTPLIPLSRALGELIVKNI